MIITTACPLRISLVGGSTDSPYFLEKYGEGSVISFPSNLKTYVTVHKDVCGANTLNKKYVLNYSKREEVDNITDIQNELIRNCFEYFNIRHINLFFTSDVFSNGSGLASSSSYLMALIKSIHMLDDISISEIEICKIAMEIERRFNPLVGQQDFYGSIGSLKKITFTNDSTPTFKYLNTDIFEEMSMFLIFTGVFRSSTDILETIDIDKSYCLLDDVKSLEQSIINNDKFLFHNTIKKTWINKKNTSKYIYENPVISELDMIIEKDPNILSHKLLGAGNGGYFLIFTEKNTKPHFKYENIIEINISELGIQTKKI